MKCIPSPKHDGLTQSRAINLSTCHWLCACRALALFAPTQGHVALVSGQMLPAEGEEPILPLRALVLPFHGLGDRGAAMGNNDTERLAVWSTLITFILSFSLCSEWGEQLEQGVSRWENAGCYKHVAYGRMKLQNQSEENALPNHMSRPTPRKGWGQSQVMLKHPLPTAAPSAPSPLQFEPGCGG